MLPLNTVISRTQHGVLETLMRESVGLPFLLGYNTIDLVLQSAKLLQYQSTIQYLELRLCKRCF
jgi:hypothetical protein